MVFGKRWLAYYYKDRFKDTKSKKIKEDLTGDGCTDFIFAEKLFSCEERITDEIPDKGDYFSIIYAKRGEESEKVGKVREPVMAEKVYFVGAGPGDPKLITLRGKELIEKADLVIYTGSLVDPAVAAYIQLRRRCQQPWAQPR